jgi:hypothetical protein
MIERQTEAALTPDEVRQILRLCSPKGLLVGGQALAFWADYLAVPRPEDLASGITFDADFIGDAILARELGAALGWKIWIPSLDDATPQTGKVTHRLSDGTVKQVDFLSGVIGLTTKDLIRRAVELEVPVIGSMRVIHPIDVLDSRIQNLQLLAEKRNRAGVAQARLAIQVVRAFIRTEIAARGERAGLRLLDRVVEISTETAALQTFLRFAINPLEAVPLEAFHTSAALHGSRWPQICADVKRRREALRRATLPDSTG